MINLYKKKYKNIMYIYYFLTNKYDSVVKKPSNRFTSSEMRNLVKVRVLISLKFIPTVEMTV